MPALGRALTPLARLRLCSWTRSCLAVLARLTFQVPGLYGFSLFVGGGGWRASDPVICQWCPLRRSVTSTLDCWISASPGMLTFSCVSEWRLRGCSRPRGVSDRWIVFRGTTTPWRSGVRPACVLPLFAWRRMVTTALDRRLGRRRTSKR
jgi:hypothetical protein